MGIVIKPNFTASDIKKMMQNKKAIIDQVLLNRLKYVGENFVKNARSNNTYIDQTANLRSSIGYVILKDGYQIFENFKKSGTTKKGKKSGNNGVQSAQKIADEVANKFDRGYVLICVAGMSYAAAVEAKNFDVITSSSIEAAEELRHAIQRLKIKISNRL